MMKKKILLSALLFTAAINGAGQHVGILFCCFSIDTAAQCSLCTKTAQQLGEGPAQGLNAGILYLMAAPLVFIGVIGYRWWKTNR